MRPAARPINRGQLHRGPARLRVVRVEDQQVFVVWPHEHALSPGSQPAGIRRQQRSSSTFQQRLAALVHIRPGHIVRTPDDRLIGAMYAAAAKIPRRKQVVVPSVKHEERRLNRFPIRGQSGLRRGRIRWRHAPCQRIQLRVATPLKCRSYLIALEFGHSCRGV